MRILMVLLPCFLFMCCKNTEVGPDNTYLNLIEEYFYSEYLKIDFCYNYSFKSSSSNVLFHRESYFFYDSAQALKKNSDSGLSYPDLLYNVNWNEIFPSYSRFYDCRSFRMMIKNTWFILLRKGSIMRLKDSIGVTFDLSDIDNEFKSMSVEAIKLFFEGNLFLVEPRGDILNSGIIRSFKYIDFEENVLSGESTLSNRISPDKSILVIEYDSAIFNEENDKAVLFIRTSLDGNWYNHLVFFEKIATRWNVLFEIRGY